MSQDNRKRLEELVHARAARPLKDGVIEVLGRYQNSRREPLDFVELPEASAELDAIFAAFELARDEGWLQESPWLNVTDALALVGIVLDEVAHDRWSLIPDAPHRVGLIRTCARPSMDLVLDVCQLTGDGAWLAASGQGSVVVLDVEDGGTGWQRARVLVASRY